MQVSRERVPASACKGLEEARDQIGRDKDIPEDTRKRMLNLLDQQTERWSDKDG